MNLDTTLQLLADDPTAPLDVAEVALLLATDEYPQLDVSGYLRQLDLLALELRPPLTGNLPEKVEALCNFLFVQSSFQGNETDYHDPKNSYFNDVLERKTGIPITLTALAMSVGHRAGMEIVGIGLPGHFIAKAIEGDSEILFDPFHAGQILTPMSCQALVEAVTGESIHLTPAAFEGTSPGAMVLRMLNNLKASYLRSGDFDRSVRIIERMRQLRPEDPSLRRDLGVALLRAGRAGQAIDHLTIYLELGPLGNDEELVRQVLATAKTEVAKWN